MKAMSCIRWLPGEHTATAERLLAADREWAAPLLWRSEFRSVLAGMVRRGRLDIARATRIAAEAEGHLAAREYAVATRDVLRKIGASRCSAYDCEFVVLAEALGVPLVTTDRQVLASFPTVAQTPEERIRGAER